MSTALEAIAARHAGMEVFGISLVTNLAAGISPLPLSHQEVHRGRPGRRPADLQAPRGNHRQALTRQALDTGTGVGLSGTAPPRFDDSLDPMTSPDADSQLFSDARAWAAQDPDPDHLARPDRLVPSPKPARRSPPGTGGQLQRHAAVRHGRPARRPRPGPNRMNRVVVRRAAAGLARFLADAVGAGRTGNPAARRRRLSTPGTTPTSSPQETAAIFTAAGIETFLMPAALPTPLLAYAVRALDCDGGVMVTASHNPPQDNGYKVYLGRHAVEESGRGAQIVAPVRRPDRRARSTGVGPLDSIPLAEDGWTVLRRRHRRGLRARHGGPGRPRTSFRPGTSGSS